MKHLKFSLLPFFLLCLASPANAIVLRGVVSEVRDGETLIVTINKQRVTVVLKAVDAPELKQEFGEVAQQHLASLILNKSVEIVFTELRSGSVVGKVICNNMDIGLQVIRDGTAWYAAKSDHNLSEEEGRVYSDAEQAARSEQRGIWQNGTPMPPWEWRRAQAAKQARPASYKNNRRSGLEREDVLFTRNSTAGNTRGNPKERSSVPKPSARPLNTPGQDYNFRSFLNQGRVTIVYFYADWCPSCRATNPVMDEINRRVPDMQVLFMNIGTWNTPVAQQYGITFVPYLTIYDKDGNFVASGRAATAWLQQALRR